MTSTRRLTVVVACLLVLPLAALQRAKGTPPVRPQDEKIRQSVAELVKARKIPGMIAAIADHQNMLGIGSAGVRKAGDATRVTDEDLIHIGSCTKAMTSLVLATLVAEGTLTWETALVSVFPEIKEAIHADFHQATLWQFVTHRSGAAANPKNWWAHGDLDISKRRLEILKESLAAEPNKVGYFRYSNLGYLVAGCMAEKRTGKSWESLVKQRLFTPLDMKSADFGPPGKPRQVDQPWGHTKFGGSWWPKQSDNAPALGPAGTVHCTMNDWAKFGALQLPKSKRTILSREQLTRLTQAEGDYAAGWKVVNQPWSRGPAFTHSGSNTMWYATIWVAPGLNRVFLVATNSFDRNSGVVCNDMILRLIELDQATQ